MNFKLHNLDLGILKHEAARARFGRRPGWERVDWKPTGAGGNMIYLRQVSLPPTCSVARTDIKLEAPPNLYEPAGRDDRGNALVHFYYNLFISPGIELHDRRTGHWIPMPRLHGGDADRFAFLCVHPRTVTRGTNVLAFIRTMDLFFMNPGYKAGGWEAA